MSGCAATAGHAIPLYSPTPPVILRRRQPNQSTLVLSTTWAATAVSSSAPCRSLRRPRRRPPPWCSRRSVVNDVHPTAVVLLQPLVFLLQPPKQASAVPPAPASRVRLCCHRWPCHPSILTHTSCYSPATAASHRSRSSQPTYSPPCGHPLPRLPRLRIVPFLGLAVVHRPGALGAAWSTWSTKDIHRKWTVRGEADSWVHDRTQGNASLLRTK